MKKFCRTAAKEERLQHKIYQGTPGLHVHTPACFFFIMKTSPGSTRRSHRRPLGSACKPNRSHAIKHKWYSTSQSFVCTCTNNYRRLAVCFPKEIEGLLSSLVSLSPHLSCFVCFLFAFFCPVYGSQQQYGSECWCGTSSKFSDYERHGEGVCHMACSGDPTVACGEFYFYFVLVLQSILPGTITVVHTNTSVYNLSACA